MFVETIYAMTISEFSHLNFDAKASLLTKYGKYIDKRSTRDGARILIYDLFGFYVEVCYRFDRKVQYLRTVNNIFESESYLEGMSLLHLN
jgi:hypothetical protein